MYLNDAMVERFVHILDHECSGYMFQLPEVAPTVAAFYGLATVYWNADADDFHATFYEQFFVPEEDIAQIEEMDFNDSFGDEDLYDAADAYDPRNAFDADNCYDDYDVEAIDDDTHEEEGSDNEVEREDEFQDAPARPPNPRPAPGPHRRLEDEGLAAQIAADIEDEDYVERYAGLYS